MKKGAFSRAGRPKSEEKRDAIIEAASDLFLTRGFRATSMDAVAERANVSKQTVYSHFKNKEDLFREVIETKVESYGFAEATLPNDNDPQAVLVTIAQRFSDLLLDEEVVSMYRVVIGESLDYPQIARLFYDTGPGTAIKAVTRLLARLMEQGRLTTDDPVYAAVLFLNMIRGPYQMQCLMGLEPAIEGDSLDDHIRKAVGQFLRLYT